MTLEAGPCLFRERRGFLSSGGWLWLCGMALYRDVGQGRWLVMVPPDCGEGSFICSLFFPWVLLKEWKDEQAGVL